MPMILKGGKGLVLGYGLACEKNGKQLKNKYIKECSVNFLRYMAV
ncbi:protein of unknown function [Legionella hackeliae]|uniref:Uncharacterized protein n=1 Tax=Legionella hackeliae TaxID=449 RepID=A0A0A8UYX0_LEGHA|nr:protein of unknown function [Legionella hackeliae]